MDEKIRRRGLFEGNRSASMPSLVQSSLVEHDDAIQAKRIEKYFKRDFPEAHTWPAPTRFVKGASSPVKPFCTKQYSASWSNPRHDTQTIVKQDASIPYLQENLFIEALTLVSSFLFQQQLLSLAPIIILD
jgi:hypothetical protein